MKHALIIGGSGMLADCCVRLADKGYHLSVVARNEKKMERLEKRIKPVGEMTKLLVDYTENEKLRTSIQQSMTDHGPVTLVVSWIHSTAPEAPQIVMDEVAKSEVHFRFFHILGSSSDPIAIKETLPIQPQGHYRSIVLGFVREKEGSRWLTQPEISEGVMSAIERDEPLYKVGVTEPWEKRPGI